MEQTDWLTEMKEFDTTLNTPWYLLGSIRDDFKIQYTFEYCRTYVDSMVRMDAERCAGHRYHVFYDARACLFWTFPALDFYRQLRIA